MKTWTNGKIIEGKHQIDSFNYSLHYSSPCVWEGLRSYTQENGATKIFKLDEHVNRLLESAKILGFVIPYSKGQIVQACMDVVEANGGGDLYLRPIAFNEIDAEGIHSQTQNVTLDIYCRKVNDLHSKTTKTIKMAISNVVRGYPQFTMQAKTPANYQCLQMTKQLLKDQKIDDIFLLDNQGYVVEASVSNFYVFRGDVAYTPPSKGSILPGITRKCVAEILQNQVLMLQKYKRMPMVIEKDITKADLYTADCVILTGTFSEIVDVVEIDERQIGDASSHFYANVIKTEYSNTVRGRNP